MPLRVTFVGPPGSGKGTQSELLANALGVPIIGPGVAYRAEIAAGTDLGKRVASIIAEGSMVPHAITNSIVEQRLQQPDCAQGYILDGYPRNLAQLQALDGFAEPLTHAISLTISEQEMYHRLGNRLVCTCGKQFNRRELQVEAGDEARCTACDGTLVRRKDDDPASIAHRLTLYREITEPLIAEYRTRGILVEVDGERAIPDVHADILQRFGHDSTTT